MQNEIRGFTADLYYELTTPEYIGEVKDNVYLNFIDYSNLDYYTSVKKGSTIIVPLILFNYVGQSFSITLGEGSLTQNYREFLTEALITECNSSTCFNLVDNGDSIAISSDYTLDVRITHNKTTSKVKLQEAAVLIPFLGNDEDGDVLTFGNSSYKVSPATTELNISVFLKKHGEDKFAKNYSVKRNYSSARGGYELSYGANRDCMVSMAESLSYATKEVVEKISQDLHLFFLSQ